MDAIPTTREEREPVFTVCSHMFGCYVNGVFERDRWYICKFGELIDSQTGLYEQDARAIAARLESEHAIASVRLGFSLAFALRKQADYVFVSEQVWTAERQHQSPND